jgi:hypothetical protein
MELQHSGKFLKHNPSFDGMFGATLSYITEIKTLCDSRKIGLTIVLIPDEAQVSRTLQTEIVEASGLGPDYF